MYFITKKSVCKEFIEKFCFPLKFAGIYCNRMLKIKSADMSQRWQNSACGEPQLAFRTDMRSGAKYLLQIFTDGAKVPSVIEIIGKSGKHYKSELVPKT